MLVACRYLLHHKINSLETYLSINAWVTAVNNPEIYFILMRVLGILIHETTDVSRLTEINRTSHSLGTMIRQLEADFWVAVFQIRSKHISNNLGSCYYKLTLTEVWMPHFFFLQFFYETIRESVNYQRVGRLSM